MLKDSLLFSGEGHWPSGKYEISDILAFRSNVIALKWKTTSQFGKINPHFNITGARHHPHKIARLRSYIFRNEMARAQHSKHCSKSPKGHVYVPSSWTVLCTRSLVTGANLLELSFNLAFLYRPHSESCSI